METPLVQFEHTPKFLFSTAAPGKEWHGWAVWPTWHNGLWLWLVRGGLGVGMLHTVHHLADLPKLAACTYGGSRCGPHMASSQNVFKALQVLHMHQLSLQLLPNSSSPSQMDSPPPSPDSCHCPSS